MQCPHRYAIMFREIIRPNGREVETITLRKKLILTFTALIVVLGVLIGFFSYQDAKQIVYSNKKSEMADTINRIDININTWVLQVTSLAENTVNNPAVLEILGHNTIPGDKRDYIDEWFHNFAQVFKAVSDIHVLDMGGQIRYSYRQHSGSADEERLAACLAVEESRPGRDNWLGSGHSLYGGPEEQVVTMVKAFSLPEHTGPDGLLVIELNPELFGSLLLSNHSMFPNQYTLIVDQNGDIISTNKNVSHTWLDEIEDRFDQGIRKFELHWDHKDYYVCGQYNGVTGWKTFSIVSLNDFFPQAKELQRAVFTMVVGAVLLAAILILLISYTFTRPIAKLTAAMKEVEEGNFNIRVVHHSRDEMGRLTDSFNFMTGKINHLVKEVYQEKLAQKNAELEALQAQINPHFLYNTLDSINWMLIEIGAMDLSDVIVSLGDILKYSIHGSDVLVPLEEEIRYIESYLCIQKNRLEERLTATIQVQEEARACMVPKLILQPVVENAILHGVEPQKAGGEIRVEARLTGGDLLVTVSDCGEGMDEEELDRCRSVISAEDPGTDSIGMRNVNRRIRLHYGEEYGLSVESRKHQGTVITLRMPQRR